MQKLSKKLSVFMAALMTVSLCLGFVTSVPVKAAAVYPQVQYVESPQTQYTVGDRVNFKLYAPNYGGRVQYRVVLWNDETKSYKDLWGTPDKYYDKWQPYGNNVFTLGWPISEPGHYRITIYVKRAGIANNLTHIPGSNCDSYMESDSFVVKAKDAGKEEQKPDIAPESIKLASESTSPAAINGFASKSQQVVVGTKYAVKANVGKAGVKVVFQIDAPADSLNKDITAEAMSDANGIAAYEYTRNYGDADAITVYPAAAPTMRDSMKLYWGVAKVLTIEATETDGTKAPNGNVMSYKVKLRNPMTGEALRNRNLYVLVRENIEAPNNAALSAALITNPYDGQKVSTYQRMYNIVSGGLNEKLVKLVTNDNGEAVFTITGNNTKATPVVFYDDANFYKVDQNYNVVLPDTSQFAPAFAGNGNGRWDATELQAEAATLAFNATSYTFEQTPIADQYAAVDTAYATGKTYTVTVKNPEGKPYAYGKVQIAINEYIDGVYGTDTNARFIRVGTKTTDLANPSVGKIDNGTGRYYQIEATANADGVVMFRIASDKVNDIATPVIWVDQDTPNAYTGLRNALLDPADPQKVLSSTIFVNQAIKSSAIGVANNNVNRNMKDDADGNLVAIAGDSVKFSYDVKDQNGNKWMPAGSVANITYVIANVSGKDVTVNYPVSSGTAVSATVDNAPWAPAVASITIPAYQTKTISFSTASATGNYVLISSAAAAKVTVTGSANIVGQTNTSNGWLAPAAKTASWVVPKEVATYAPAYNMFTAKVFGYDLVNNFVIVVPNDDATNYVKVNYAVTDNFFAYTTQYMQPIPSGMAQFEAVVSTDDVLTYKYNGAASAYIALYNADWTDNNDVASPATEVKVDNGTQATSLDTIQISEVAVLSGTVGAPVLTIGDKVIMTAVGMNAEQVAQAILVASPITVNGVQFNVTDPTPGDGKVTFTSAAAVANIDFAAIINTVAKGAFAVAQTNTQVGVKSTQGSATITVKAPVEYNRNITVTFTDGATVVTTAPILLVAGQTADQAAASIAAALNVPGYTVTVTGSVVTITKTAPGASNISVTVNYLF